MHIQMIFLIKRILGDLLIKDNNEKQESNTDKRAKEIEKLKRI